MNLIVYFHGFGSNANSDKVRQLEAAFPNDIVLSWNIDHRDPDQSIKELCIKLDSTLIDGVHKYRKVVFVGTSLGAWYAKKLAEIYHAEMWLANPCFEPSKTLVELKVESEIANKYEKIIPPQTMVKYFLSKYDEVIDHSELITEVKPSLITIVDGETHRFHKRGFQLVMEDIEKYLSK